MSEGIDHVRHLMDHPEDVDLPDDLVAEGDLGDDGPPEPPAPSGGDGEEPPPEARCARLPLNDFGNGQRFALHFGEDVIWVPRVGWFVWTGQVWRKDSDEIAVRQRAQQMGALIGAEIPYVTLVEWQMEQIARERELREERRDLGARTGEDGKPDPAARARLNEVDNALGAIAGLKKSLSVLRREHRSFARTSGNTARIDATYKEAGFGLSRQLDEMDATPLDVNCEGGVLRFTVSGGGDAGYSRVAEVQLRAHDRAHLLTKMAPVGYDTGAPCPLFDAFLTRIQPDPDMRAFLQRWFGLSMTALLVQKLAFFHGGGANGKSVLVDLIARVLGDYATTAKIESLTGTNRRGGGDATPDLIPLIGARMVRASEPDEGQKLQEGLIKELTGGEKIMVRALHSDFVEVRPEFKLTISGNHRPEIRGTDDGIWRRVMLVPFEVQIPEGERDPHLGEKLWGERAGILNWLVEGLLAYLEGGLQEPDRVLAATKEFREESDPVATFLQTCCVITGQAEDSVPARELGEAFNVWLDDRGEGQWQPRTIALRLKDKSSRWKCPATGHGFTQRKASTMFYDGVRFNDVFARHFRDLPRDATGRILRTRAVPGEP